jgi:trimeric autotransporter adhesin
MAGGNTGGTYTGTSARSVTKNLITPVGNTATTMGIPTIAGTGQAIGSSRIGSTMSTNCICTQLPNSSASAKTAKVGISIQGGNDVANWPENLSSGSLAIESKTQGFVITRVANTSSIASPVEGMMVMDTTADCMKLYNGTTWNCITQTCNEY